MPVRQRMQQRRELGDTLSSLIKEKKSHSKTARTEAAEKEAKETQVEANNTGIMNDQTAGRHNHHPS